MRTTRRTWRRLRPATAVLAVALVAPVPGAAAAGTSDRAEVYGAQPEIGMLTISPDGRTAAWRKTSAETDAIIVYSLAEQRSLGGVSLDGAVNPSGLQWATNDKLILVVSKHSRLAGFKGKHDVSSAWLYDPGTSRIKPLLVPGDTVYRGQTGLGNVVGVSPDGKYVYMPAFFGNGLGSGPSYSLMRVNLANPVRPRLSFAGKPRSADFLLDADGEVLVHEYFDDSGKRHVIAARRGKDWQEVYALDTELPEIVLVGMTRDYNAVVVSRYDEDSRRRSYYTMSLAGGGIAGLFGREDADVGSVFTDINRVVHGARYSGFTPSYEFLDSRVTVRLAEITRRVAGNSVWLIDWTRDWSTLVVYVEGPAFSGQYYVLEEGAEPLLLANARPGFDDDTIHPVTEYSYTAADGLRIPALLTIPRGRIDDIRDLPAVLLPHGGPAAHDTIGFDWFAQALADEGYLVIQPQFRGSTGFGLDHYEAGHGEWGRKMQSDLGDGLKALVAKGYVDPDRVCIVGMSYGGYAALAGGAFQPGLFRCVVSINGVSDLNRLVDHKAYWSGDGRTTKAYFARTLGGGELDRKYLDSISPSEHGEAFTVPVLLMHGEDDEIVPIDQSRRMHSSLARAGKDVTFIELPDGSHGLQSYDNRVRVMRETVDFVNRHLAGT